MNSVIEVSRRNALAILNVNVFFNLKNYPNMSLDEIVTHLFNHLLSDSVIILMIPLRPEIIYNQINLTYYVFYTH